MTVILIGGSVTDVYVNDFSNPGGLDVEQDITAPGFQPDLVFALSIAGSSFGGATNNGLYGTFGFAQRDGASPPTQRSIGIEAQDAQATTAVSSRFCETGIAHKIGSGADVLEVNNFDASGFSVFCRDSNSAGGIDFAYMCVKGVTSAIVTHNTPTSTGSANITGAGFTPSFGMIAANALASVNSDINSPGGESFGVGAFTATAQGFSSIWSDDATTPSNCESVTDDVVINLRSSSGAGNASPLVVADLTAFNSDGAQVNYTTVDTGSLRKTAVLFVRGVTAYSLSCSSGSYAISGQAITTRVASPLYLRYRK
jgi:hypothetical protein